VLKKTVTVKLLHPADAGWFVVQSPRVLIDRRSFSCRTRSSCTLPLHIVSMPLPMMSSTQAASKQQLVGKTAQVRSRCTWGAVYG